MPFSRPVFQSFLQAGFECSCHRNRLGERLNILESSRHNEFAFQDFQRVKAFGMETIRTAVCWPVIEEVPGQFDFSSADVLLDAARAAEVQLVFDVLHFGWPDHIDVFSSAFPGQFALFTSRFARHLKARGLRQTVLAAVNEISFLSWAGGDKAAISPHAIDRGHEFKRNLVRASAAASEVLLNELPGVRLLAPEPAIHIVGDPNIPGDVEEAAAYTLAQFETWDMLSGRLAPELGGRPEYLDILGVNFYERNQWVHNSTWIPRSDQRYRHLRQILRDIWDRYQRPMLLAETGTEDDRRAGWFAYVCDEVEAALASGIPLQGICLYPVVNHPGWDDGRHCCNGLFDYADDSGHREIYPPLADAIRLAKRKFFKSRKDNTYDDEVSRPSLLCPSSMGVRVSATAAPDEPLRSKS